MRPDSPQPPLAHWLASLLPLAEDVPQRDTWHVCAPLMARRRTLGLELAHLAS